jgi:pimeloyl-ACP methyl ester carboxylesterase
MRMVRMPAGAWALQRRTLHAMACLLVACALAGCASNVAYRTSIAPGDGVCVGSTGACAGDAWQQLSVDGEQVPANPVHLGFIEFDDQGALHRPELKDEMIGRIRRLGEQTPLLIVVFAHGWKHNALASDSNVVDFSRFLQRVALEDERACVGQPCAKRRVVGVYLGWRGLSASVEPFKELSFWARKNRAHRVGTDGVMEVLADLKDIDAENKQGLLVLLGHSFGGAVIYTAVQQQLMRDTAFLKSGSVARESADLVVLVNPAFEAERFQALQRRAATMQHSRTQRPILAVFTSRNDTATKWAFPLGRAFGTLFQSHVSKEQKRRNRIALGHYGPFITHNLNLAAATSENPDVPLRLAEHIEYGCAWQAYQAGSTDIWSLGALELGRMPSIQNEAQRRNPYFNVSVDPGIIASHNDIWGERFSQFLYRFIAVQSWRRRQTCPV